MFCTRCGSKYSQNIPFCSNCGFPAEINPDTSHTLKAIDQLFDYGPWDIAQLPFEDRPTLATYLSKQPAPRSKPVAHTEFSPVSKNAQNIQQASPGFQSHRINIQPDKSLPFDEATWLMPVPHSPFSDVPLPQPSQQFTMVLQPSGEIVALMPDAYTQHSPEDERGSADFPTAMNSFSLNSIGNQPAARIPFSNKYASPPQLEPVLPFERVSINDQPTRPIDNAFALAPQSMENQIGTGYPYALTAPPQSPRDSRKKHKPSPSTTRALVPASPTDVLAPADILTGKLIRPLPVWAMVLLLVAGTLLLGAIVFFSPDWANGAIIASAVAFILAILLLIILGVRVALGMLMATNPRRRSQVISTILIVLLLLLFGGTSIIQQSGLHAAQARYLEKQQHWQIALNEYEAAGENTPTSVDLARLYNEWGEDLNTHQQYSKALEKFSTVINDYKQVTPQVNQSKTNIVKTYIAWSQFDSQQQNFLDATAHYDTLLNLSYCDATCNTHIQSVDAIAYYQLAEQQLKAQQFSSAVNAFQTLSTNFAGSSQARQIHSDYARALWGLGQQQLTQTCQDAVKTYKQLANQFTDTTQGKAAANALQQPVNVKGRFTTTLPPAPSTPTVALVQGLFAGIQQFQFPTLLRNAPSVPVASDGSFAFTSIPQGTYELIWSNDGNLHYFYARNGDQVLYTSTLGPLCTYNFGNINEVIPAVA